eukprot:g7513.t1
MKYRVLGDTGLQVSVLSYGFWATAGSKGDLQQERGVAAAKSCMRVARAHGVNLFDNAEVYGKPPGEAERVMGEALAQLVAEDPPKWRRSELVITTKLFFGGSGVNEQGLSVKHAREGMAASLRRLQLEYVDLVFCHRPDPLTPTETVVRAMSGLVHAGQATAWGTSEWSAQQITEAVWLARALGLAPPQFEQPQYHMFERERVEREYAPLYQPRYNIGTTVWSPLASGLLTGKYNDAVPEGSRLATKGYTWLARRLKQWRAQGRIEQVRRLAAFAKEALGCSVAQLAVAWCLRNVQVTTVLLGASRPAQLEETLGALDVAQRLTTEHVAVIEEILRNRPQRYEGYGGVGARKLESLSFL